MFLDSYKNSTSSGLAGTIVHIEESPFDLAHVIIYAQSPVPGAAGLAVSPLATFGPFAGAPD